ncbi:hypothetical protein AB7M17_001014 [Bradyrhizobium sp. USDA 377]
MTEELPLRPTRQDLTPRQDASNQDPAPQIGDWTSQSIPTDVHRNAALDPRLFHDQRGRKPLDLSAIM